MKLSSQVPKLPRRLMYEMIELPCLHQLIQVIMQGPAVLRSMSLVLMVMVIKALVSPR